MFEHIVNIFEVLIFTFTLFSLCKEKRPGKGKYLASVIFFLFQFLFVTIVNMYSMTESVFTIVELLASFLYVSIISYDSIAYRFFICAIPYNITGIENTIQNTTFSYILFGKIDFYLLASQYRVFNVITSQLIHVVLFYFVVKIVRSTKLVVNDKNYFILGLLFFLCNFMTICFEAVACHFDNQDLFMLLGIYSTVLFIVLAIRLFILIHHHSIIQDKQQIQLDILRNQRVSNKKILEAQNNLYKLRHDMKHLIQVLNNPNIYNDKNAFKNTIEEYEALVKNTVVPITTVSAPVNYVLNIKKEEAIRKGIDFTTTLNITHDINMEDSDIYLLLSNLLDNAIEHIGILKRIRVEMSDVGKMFKIKISNSIDHSVLNKDGTFINNSNDPEHGFGIKTIESILQKYDGFISYSEDSNQLIASVIIYN